MLRLLITNLSLVTILSATAAAQTVDPLRDAISLARKNALDAPPWLKNHAFKQNMFTFVRIQYDTWRNTRGRANAGMWATDYPEADLNLAAQVGQLTKLDVTQSPTRVIRLTDPALAQYPFIYFAEGDSVSLSDAEAKALRNYLEAGGFLMIDDYWGEEASNRVRLIMKQVFPNRPTIDLPLSHALFHCVFDLREKPQVLSIHAYVSRNKDERAKLPEARYSAIQDDRGRIMVVMCHNTDLADGWERVGESEEYAREMSRAKAFPIGINIIYYALTQ